MTNDHHELSAVQRPIESAVGLPNAHYINSGMFQQEISALLMRQWAGIAVGADIPEMGDAVPIEFCGVPLLILRDQTNHIRVFQNVCRHRGAILVDKPCKIEGVIRCHYHSWCYAPDGKLISTPHVGGIGKNTHPFVNKSELGLIEVPAHIWSDIIFVNIAGTAPAFEEQHGELLERWSEFKVPVYHGGENSQFELLIEANWKLAIENYCESYHLPFVHPNLNTYSRLEDHYHIEEKRKFSGQGTYVYRQLKKDDGTVFPDFPSLSEKWKTAGEYITFFPNVMVGVQRDHIFVILLNPKAVNRTIETIHIYYAAQNTDTELRQKNAEQWQAVFIEDISVIESMQRGRLAPGFDGGRFSPVMDGPTHLFHDWVASKMEDNQQTMIIPSTSTLTE